MAHVEALEESFRNLLQCLREMEEKEKSDAEEDPLACSEREALLVQSYAERVCKFNKLLFMQVDTVNRMWDHIRLLEDKKVALHLLTAEMIALAIELDKNNLQDQVKMLEKLEKKQADFDDLLESSKST